MRLSKRGRPNAFMEAPGWGRVDLVVTAIGYGFNVVATEGEARTTRTFYPFVRTSGQWYIDCHFATRTERDTFNAWLLFYTARITNPRMAPLQPVSVIVPSHDFHKVGYPTSSIDFGDDVATVEYNVVVSMQSASNPLTTAVGASRYVSPKTDPAANKFYPAGTQVASPPPTADGGTVYGGTTGGVFRS